MGVPWSSLQIMPSLVPGFDPWPGTVKSYVCVTQYGSGKPLMSIVTEGNAVSMHYT